MNAIEITELCFGYDPRSLALKNVNMNIKKGSLTAILGCNGAGKSTLFLNLNGILKPRSGKILVEGEQLQYSKNALLQMRRNVGIVFQNPDDQLFSADVFRDISFGPTNLGLPREIVRERVEEAMQRVGITHLRERPTHALSYGQKKRVAIAGVLAMQPKVIILDEPTAGLDPFATAEIMALLDELKSDRGITIVLAMHDMDLVPTYADYVFVMNASEVIGEGTPEEIFADRALVERAGLRLPILSELAELLRAEGIEVDRRALTPEQMCAQIRRLVKR